MPDGTKLKQAKLRGVESQGMILSERELQISEEHTGIMVLEDEVAPGTPLADVVQISTDVLVLEITPNRPDCLGIYGVAREVAATTGAQLKAPPWEQDPGSLGPLEGIEITNEAGHDLCPRFTARIIEDIKLGAEPAVAKGAADGVWPAADLKRRRHHQLRDAADRPADARVRLRARRRPAPERTARACR